MNAEGRGRFLKEYVYRLIVDPSFMGALLGAVITGFIAIFIMHRTNVNNRKHSEKKEINEFLKESRFLIYSVEKLSRHISIYIGYQKEDEMAIKTDTGPYPNPQLAEIRHAKKLNEADITEYLSKVKSVNRKSFTKDTFDIYLEILSVTEGQIEYFWQRSLNKDVSGVGDILESAIDDLNALKQALEVKYEEKEKEYNAL